MVFAGTGGDSVPFTTGANITTASTTGRLLITAAINFGTTTTLILRANNTSGAELFLRGKLTGTGTLSVSRFYTAAPTVLDAQLVIQSDNNTTFTGAFTQGSNVNVSLGAINSLWRQTQINLGAEGGVTSGTTTAAGYGTADAGYNQQHGSIGRSGRYSVATNNAIAFVLAGFNNVNTTLSGADGLAGFNRGSSFGKVGTGTLSISGDSGSYQAMLQVRDGNLTISGATGSLRNQIALLASDITTYAGAQIRLNNATATNPAIPEGRLSNTAIQRLAGGVIRIDGNGTAAQSETLGTAKIISGQSVLNLNNSTATSPNVALAFAGLDLTRLSLGGQLSVIGTNLGGTGTTGTSAVTFGGTVTATNNVLPFGLAQFTYVSAAGTAGILATNPDSLLELTTGGAVRPLMTNATNTFASATANVLVNAPQALLAAGSANSLTIDTAGSITTTATLTVTSGGIVNRNTAGSIGGAGTLTTAGRIYLNTVSSSLLTVSGPISASGISKGGAGTVTLLGAMTLPAAAVVAANSGTLNVVGATGFPADTVFQVSRGANLNVGSFTGTLCGNGTVVGSTTAGAGFLLVASSLASDLATGTSPGALNFSGTLSITGGTYAVGAGNSRLRFSMTSVFGGQYTRGIITAAGADFTNASVAALVFVQPQSQLLSDVGKGNVYDFVNQTGASYRWTLLSSTAPLTGLQGNGLLEAKFKIDDQFFTNEHALATAGNQFFVTSDANNLYLNYGVPIPEPISLCIAALGGVYFTRRRR